MTLAKRDQGSGAVVLSNAGEVVAAATDWANHLMAIVERQGLFTTIRGKRYMHADAWLLIARFDQADPVVASCERIEEDGQTVAYEVRVDLVRHGERVGSAIMVCGMDEFVAQGKSGYAKHRAVMR